MDFIGAYITIFFIIFLVFPTFFMCIKLITLCCYGTQERRVSVNNLGPNVRQVPVYTIGSDPRCNDTTSNFTDYFWNVSSQNTRANEPTKDDKDLPSYEDIMRMEMARQVIDSAVQAPITTTTIHTVETSQPPPPPATSPPVRLPV
ncbi:uncharacterized protein LOC129951000 isoform X2 [Eupeodes corollae]|uniref:uncharacterized protein LOC129951000 isoform X2 n=1 Tax=Eupeodes corollae TaxID=290404 RepID=UPI002491BDAD|nr:uncharacterized protein LOC129951000 isoform X2 [Eupeodes corollae]